MKTVNNFRLIKSLAADENIVTLIMTNNVVYVATTKRVFVLTSDEKMDLRFVNVKFYELED